MSEDLKALQELFLLRVMSLPGIIPQGLLGAWEGPPFRAAMETLGLTQGCEVHPPPTTSGCTYGVPFLAKGPAWGLALALFLVGTKH